MYSARSEQAREHTQEVACDTILVKRGYCVFGHDGEGILTLAALLHRLARSSAFRYIGIM